jgi:adenosylcobinamide-phosphate synthase
MNLLVDQTIIFLIAIIIDLAIGDPPEKMERFYPIVWISLITYFFDDRTKRGNPGREKLLGMLYCIVIISVFSLPCLMLFTIHSEALYIVLSACIFKMTFTIKGLERYARYTMVEDLDEKRTAVSKIVSRDTRELDDEHLNSATIESLAENLTDSVISPFFYFALFGVFGAMVYRVINTLDAVVGYKNRKYLYFGWFPARLDDIMNYIPERIAARLIYKGSLKMHALGNGIKLPIVAMSYALEVKLEKAGCYSIGEHFEDANKEDIPRAIKIIKSSTIFFAFICVLILILLYLGGWTWLSRELHYMI